MSNSDRSAASSRPTTQMPCSLSWVSVAGQTADERDRHVLDRAGRRLRHGRRDVHRAMSRQEDPVDAGAVAVADDRAEVARIGDAIDRDEERLASLPAPEQFGEVSLLETHREGDDALRRLALGAGLELRASDRRHRHPVCLGQFEDVGDGFVVEQFRRQPDLVDLARSRRSATRGSPGDPRSDRRRGPCCPWPDADRRARCRVEWRRCGRPPASA